MAGNSRIIVTRLSTIAYLALCSLVSMILIQTGVTPYDAGVGDHLVLSPAGLLRNDSSLYLNDFFIHQTKMPHWAFEFYTALASRIGQLGPMYFTYWLITVCFSAYAHLVIARKVSYRFSHSLAVVMLTTQLMGVRTMFGTSAVVLNQALPHSLAASIGFVVIASHLSKKRNLTFLYLPFLPLIHIQVGTIVVGIVMLLVLLERISGQTIERKHLLTFGASIGSIAFGLVYRPIAGNIQDFSRLCRDLLPHHCYAPSWSSTIMQGCFLFLGIAIVGFLFIDKGILNLWQRISLYALPSVTLASTLIIDRNSFGWLANFVRGNNVYRVAVVLLPWVYWVPVLIARSEGRKLWRFSGVFLSVFLLVRLMNLTEHGNYFESNLMALSLLFVTIACVFELDKSKWLSGRGSFVPLLMVGIAILPSFTGLKLGQQSFHRPNLTFQPNQQFVEFGKALKQDVDPGQVVVGNPVDSWIRMASGRAYGVDCKFRPISGGRPLYEYYKRINPLGGYDNACNRGTFSTVTVDNLIDYYDASSADLLLIPTSDERINGLRSRGWLLDPSSHIQPFGWVLISKP